MLILNAALILVHPLPDTLQEGFAADLMAIYALLIQQPLDDVLRGDTGVILSRHPQGVIALHAMVANEDIFNGGGDGVTKAKRSRGIWWRHTDNKRSTGRTGLWLEVAPFFPAAIPVGFNGLRLAALWQGQGCFAPGGGCHGVGGACRPPPVV